MISKLKRLTIAAVATVASGSVDAEAAAISASDIDQAVADFTGVEVGQPGGARHRADPRLRLNSCPSPLATSWHGTSRRTVRVACEAGETWQIFIAIAPQTRPAKMQHVIKRGDKLTVSVQGRGFTIQRPGEATGDGAIGEWIAVRMTGTDKTLTARIARPGLVVVEP